MKLFSLLLSKVNKYRVWSIFLGGKGLMIRLGVIIPVNLVAVSGTKVKVEISLRDKCCQTVWTRHEREWGLRLRFTSLPSFAFQNHCIPPVLFSLHDFVLDKWFPVVAILCFNFPSGVANSCAFQVSFYYVLETKLRATNFSLAFFQLCIKKT